MELLQSLWETWNSASVESIQKFGALASIVLAGVTVFAIFQSRSGLKEAKKANEISQELVLLQTNVIFELTYRKIDKGPVFDIDVMIENIGNSPAMDLTIEMEPGMQDMFNKATGKTMPNPINKWDELLANQMDIAASYKLNKAVLYYKYIYSFHFLVEYTHNGRQVRSFLPLPYYSINISINQAFTDVWSKIACVQANRYSFKFKA